jgi:hypothetical protein
MVVQGDLSQLPSVMQAEEPAPPPCRHHWIIETANGPSSLGVCQFCWETREFKNSIGEPDRDFEGPPERGASSKVLQPAASRRS